MDALRGDRNRADCLHRPSTVGYPVRPIRRPCALVKTWDSGHPGRSAGVLHGSAAATQNKKEWYIFHAAGDNTAHAKNAYKFVVWKTTSFIETFACKGGAQYANISSSNLSCSTNWIEE